MERVRNKLHPHSQTEKNPKQLSCCRFSMKWKRRRRLAILIEFYYLCLWKSSSHSTPKFFFILNNNDNSSWLLSLFPPKKIEQKVFPHFSFSIVCIGAASACTQKLKQKKFRRWEEGWRMYRINSSFNGKLSMLFILLFAFLCFVQIVKMKMCNENESTLWKIIFIFFIHIINGESFAMFSTLFPHLFYCAFYMNYIKMAWYSFSRFIRIYFIQFFIFSFNDMV